MKRLLPICIGCALLSLFAMSMYAQGASKSAGKAAKPLDYTGVYSQLMGLEADPTKVASVSRLMFRRDAANFFLEQGEIYLCKPVGGRVCAAIFMGSGKLSYTPPTDVERKQLARFFDKESLQKDFKVLCMIFADSTVEELSRGLKFTSAQVPASVKDEIENSLEYVSDDEYKYFDESIVNALLNNDKNDLFYARIAEDKSDPIFFRIDPYEEEEVQLSRRDHASTHAHATDLINSFHRQVYYSNEDYLAAPTESIDIQNYTIDATIADNLEFSASTDFQFKPIKENLKWVNLQLTPTLSVDSMQWSDGAAAEYFQTGAGTIWVECDGRVAADKQSTLKMKYHGKVIDRKIDYFFLLDPHYWYPRHGYKKKATFDLTFHTPTRYKFASIGEKMSSSDNDDITTSHWVARTPVRNASFNIGVFTDYRINKDTLPAITVYMSEGGHGDMGEAMIEEGITSGSDMEKQVGEDVENSCLLFQHLFGRSSATALYVTEIPYSHGEAFPGLIHLWWKTFQRTDESGFDHFFRAHEVSHQWWGIGVDFKTYHDQWLSEGFATYSGLLYVQAVKKDNEKFFKMLSDYQKEILGNRKSIFGNGKEAGPIWLGYRTNSSSTEGDYNLIIYKKGAWVLHMLRNMLLDMNTMKEDKFFDAMRDFYNTYKGKEATTGDFQKVVEKHVGVDLGWFFNEWVFGIDVPSYKFAYKVADAPDGKYKVTCRIEQSNVPDNFQMYVPIKIDFGDNRIARLRVQVKGHGAEFDLPPMPMKPKEVIFNDLQSVLCEVDNVSW